MTSVRFCLLQMRRDMYMLHSPQRLENECHDTTSLAILRCRYARIPLGLSFNQYGFYPLSIISSYHSVATW